MTEFINMCYNKNMEKNSKDQDSRKCVLAVKVTAEEKEKVINFAAERCINVSALIRKLLFDKLDNTT